MTAAAEERQMRVDGAALIVRPHYFILTDQRRETGQSQPGGQSGEVIYSAPPYTGIDSAPCFIMLRSFWERDGTSRMPKIVTTSSIRSSGPHS